MQSTISFMMDGKVVEIDFSGSGVSPTTTVLNYLRSLPAHKGVKEGCAEGDCGACTVVVAGVDANNTLRYNAVDSCLMFLPMLHGKQLITVENLKDEAGTLHPVQRAMVETGGSQCGYCTPGIVMSLFALYKNSQNPSHREIEDALGGNLCRCTGYKPIIEAATRSCVHDGVDHFTNNEAPVIELLKLIPQQSIHIQTDRQQYFRPVSLGEAIALKHQHPEATVICGATDIALRITKNHEEILNIIDLSGVDELKAIVENETSVSVGAAVSLSDVMPGIEKDFHALYEMLQVFGSEQIRNLATIGGSLGTASPIGDIMPVLMAYDAKIMLESLNGRREVPLDRYVTGYRQTVRKSDELITSIVIPKPVKGTFIRSYKISKRKDLDISTVSGGFALALNDGRIVKDIKLVYGGMAERTKRATNAEQFLAGKPWNRETVEKAMFFVDQDFTPISDARSGAEFRKVVARNLLLKFWSETAEQ